MRVSPLVPTLAIGLVLALGGCGSDDDGGSSTSTTAGSSAAATAGGQTISGTGYRTEVPKDWRDRADLAEGTAFKVDRLYASPTGDDSFRSNVVIIRENPKAIRGKKIEDLESQLRQQSAQAVGASVPDADEPLEMDGEDAVRWTLRRKQGDVDLVQRQLGVIHDDALYSITLTTTADDDDRGEATAKRLVDGWRWE